MILFHVYERSAGTPAPTRRLDAEWSIVPVAIEEVALLRRRDIRHCFFDVDVTQQSLALLVRALLPSLEPGGVRLFACRPGDRHAAIQAAALGATALVESPAADAVLLGHLRDPTEGGPPVPASVGAGGAALELTFTSLRDGRVLPSDTLSGMADLLSDDIGTVGIDAWLRSIRSHHVGTYQHCMTVTGLATAFGQSLGLSSADLGKLTTGALLHDIGKARVDVAILDKAGPLTPAEREVVQKHPVWGDEYLAARSDVSSDVRAMVRGHHEYLDGTGYPDGLRGSQIDDLTRLLTIADVFGALVEQRPYKPPMPSRDALGVLRTMVDDRKLERALVRAFAPVAAQLRLAE